MKMAEKLQNIRTKMEQIRQTDFVRLKDQVYLDHAGAAQYPTRLLQNYLTDLSTHLYSNPHSSSLSGGYVGELVANVRYRILQHFNTTPDEYSIIFTSGCTAALKLLAESFDFCGEDSLKSKCENNGESNELYAGDPTFCDDTAKNEKQDDVAGSFYFLNDNHTSVMGMREVASLRGATVNCFDEEQMVEFLKANSNDHSLTNGNCLIAFPAQSNFCGRRYPLQWISEIKDKKRKSKGKFVLLDAAGYVTTSDLDLTRYKPDFLTVSFYKMFGFPTGLGALIVKNDSAHILRKTYFGGGTVKVAVPSEMFHAQKDNLSERFEDGTINYLDILALRHAFETFTDITGGIQNVSNYVFAMTRILHRYLKNSTHSNGNPIAEVYADNDFSDPTQQGPIIVFNILRANGEHMGFSEVSKLAQLYNIHLRTGCFCNQGGCQRHLNLSNEHIKKNFQEGHVCGDDVDLVDGKPTGGIRISLGYSTIMEDISLFIKFIEDCILESNNHKMGSQDIQEFTDRWWGQFSSAAGDKDLIESVRAPSIAKSCDIPEEDVIADETPLLPKPLSMADAGMAMDCTGNLPQPGKAGPGVAPHVTQICIYPVKSCGGFTTQSWEIGPRGFLYDREWMIVDTAGINLTQKKCPELVHIQPSIDLSSMVLTLSFPGMNSVSVPLDTSAQCQGLTSQMTCLTPVCRDTVQGHVCSGADVSEWLEQAICATGLRLVHQDTTQVRKTKRKPLVGESASSLSLANETQYLLISQKSVNMFHSAMVDIAANTESDPGIVPNIANLTARFRANIVVDGDLAAYEEESWKTVTIFGKTKSLMNVQGMCKRCQVICMDQSTGEKHKDVFRALSAMTQRKVTFGVLLNHADSDIQNDIRIMSVGNEIIPDHLPT